jgi:hypothetical protein
MLAPEDRPPAWLSDYGGIEADIEAMSDFASGLSKEVSDGYGPHLSLVTSSMLTQLPGAGDHFPEMQAFLKHHHEAQTATFSNAFNYRYGTDDLANAAKTISKEYRGSDAFAAASVHDVDKALASNSSLSTKLNESTAGKS